VGRDHFSESPPIARLGPADGILSVTRQYGDLARKLDAFVTGAGRGPPRLFDPEELGQPRVDEDVANTGRDLGQSQRVPGRGEPLVGDGDHRDPGARNVLQGRAVGHDRAFEHGEILRRGVGFGRIEPPDQADPARAVRLEAEHQAGTSSSAVTVVTPSRCSYARFLVYWRTR